MLCMWWHGGTDNWNPIPGVFLPHSQGSQDRLQIHCNSHQDKVRELCYGIMQQQLG